MAEPCKDCPPIEPDFDKRVIGTDVWYGDGTMYRDADWAELPNDDVQFVAVRYVDGTRRVMHGATWYFRAQGVNDWIYGDGISYDPKEEIDDRYEDIVILRGRYTDDATFKAIVERAMSMK